MHSLNESVNKGCHFMHSLNIFHWQTVKHILQNLADTFDHGLMFEKPIYVVIQGFADADWAFYLDDRKST